MKSFFTKLCLAFLITFSLVQFTNAQVYIWGGPGDANSEFNGGLNDWTTSNEAGAFWGWTEDGTGSEGTYWGTRGPIGSASVANGAAIFNSDKFHSKDGIGYPHRGELTSPVFSCEGHSTVWLRFDQIARYWQSSNETFVQVSTDGGTTWLPADGISANAGILRGNWAAWPRDEQKLFDLTEYAADQANVQIRFVWQGAYYYWIIDDVYVMEQPEVDLEISAILYDPIAAEVPETQLDARPTSFALNVPNHGASDVTDAVIGVEVTNLDGIIMYSDSLTDVSIASGDTAEIEFENTFLASDYGLTQGRHYINYWARVPGVVEQNSKNNGWQERFYVGESYYDKAYYSPYNAWGLENYGAFSIFKTGSWSNNDAGWIFRADSVSIACSDGNDEPTFIADVNVFLYKVSDDVAADFSNFEMGTVAQLDPGEDPHPQLEMVGFGFETSFQHDDYDVFNIGLYDINFDEKVVLEPNTRYLIMSYWDNDKSLYHVADRYKFHNGTPACGWYAADADGAWSWDFDPWFGWNLGMNIEYVLSTDKVILPESTLEVFPNPVNTQINVNIALETVANEATLVLTDINNKYITSQLLTNLGTSRETVDVSNVPSGNYILRLVTKEGVASQKIIIQH